MSEIYAEHSSAVYRCLLAWTRSAALAEELTAETFYRAIVADQPVRAATARGYLIAIARNSWRKHCARNSREAPIPAETAAPGQCGESRVDLQRTLEAISALPEELREPLVFVCAGRPQLRGDRSAIEYHARDGKNPHLPCAAEIGELTMTLHPDILTDLVILYHAGEASQASRALLEEEASRNARIAAA